MITFSTISKNIQETLFDRMSMLERDVSVSDFDKNSGYKIGDKLSNEKGETKSNYMFTRSTFMRMISLTPPVLPNGSIGKPIVLMGGEATLKDGQYGITHKTWGGKSFNQVDYEVEGEWTDKQKAALISKNLAGFAKWGKRFANLMTGGVISSLGDNVPNEDIGAPIMQQKSFNVDVIDPGKYWKEGEAQPYRPMPGVKDVTIEYKGSGMQLGATREAQINWVCWTFADLDRMMAHFLHHGKTVMIDWGWSGVGDLRDVEPYEIFDEKGDFKTDAEIDHIQSLHNHVITQKGNYDAMIGVVSNFEWAVRDDGGFDCVTTLISTGVNILEQKLKTTADARLSALPLFFKDTRSEKINEITYVTPELSIPGDPVGEKKNVTVDYSSTSYASLNPYWSTDTSTKVKYTSGPEATKKYAAYMTFDLYLDDIVKQMLGHLNNEKVMKSGHIIKLNYKYKFETDEVTSGFTIPLTDTTIGGGDTIIQKITVIGTYVTWGWFEDNVLSRFFSKAVAGGGVIGAIRSIESVSADEEGLPITHSEQTMGSVRKAKDAGKTDADLRGYNEKWMNCWKDYENWKDGKVGNTKVKTPILIRNHPNMVTTDSGKFLIVNSSSKSDKVDVTEHFIQKSWGEWEQRTKGKFETSGRWQPTNADHYGYLYDSGARTGQWTTNDGTYLNNPLNEDGGINIHRFRDENIDPNSGVLRNVYFNITHLKEKMKGAVSIKAAIQAVWDDFSAEYGGIYDFKIAYSDDGNQIMVMDNGWTQNTVKDLLEDRSHRGDPGAEDKTPEATDNFTGLFHFPVWEKSSVVKSQNLTAKLPDRMQNAAMFAGNNAYGKPEEESTDTKEDEDKVATLDERQSMAWGNLVSPLNERLAKSEGLSTAQWSKQVLADVIAGGYNFPYQENQKFGSETADISKPLGIGEDSSGTIIQDSIIERMMEQHYNLYIDKKATEVKRMKELEKQANIEVEDASDLEQRKAEINKKRRNFERLITGGTKLAPGNLYEDVRQIYGGRTMKLIPLYKNFMIENMKGNKDGIISTSDPLIPVDFELDIDGIAGIYPGNAFQSTYLPSRYKEMACFQTMGVNQQVSSDGWTSTIKGQIRVSIAIDKKRKSLHGMVVWPDKLGGEGVFLEPVSWTPPPFPGRPSVRVPIGPSGGDYAGILDDVEIIEPPMEEFKEWAPPEPYIEPDPSEDEDLVDDLEIVETELDEYPEWETPPPYEKPPPYEHHTDNPFPHQPILPGDEGWQPTTWDQLGVNVDNMTPPELPDVPELPTPPVPAELPDISGIEPIIATNFAMGINEALQNVEFGNGTFNLSNMGSTIPDWLDIASLPSLITNNINYSPGTEFLDWSVEVIGNQMMINILEHGATEGRISEAMGNMLSTIQSYTSSTGIAELFSIGSSGIYQYLTSTSEGFIYGADTGLDRDIDLTGTALQFLITLDPP